MSRKLITGILVVCILAVLPLAVLAEGDAAAAKTQPEILTLEQCLDLAYKNSQQLKAAEKNVEIAQAAVKETKAGLYPSLTYQYGYTKLGTKTPGMLAPAPGQYPPSINQWQYIPGTDTASNAGFTLTQPLYTGGKLADALKIAEIRLETAKEDERKTKEQLVFSVKEAYYQCWVLTQMLTVAQNSLSTMDRHVDQVNAYYKVGTVSKFDLLKAQVQRDSLKPQVVKAQNGLALAKLGLLTLIGKDKDFPFEVSIDAAKVQIPAQNDINFNQTLEAAYSNRTEMRQVQQLAQMNKILTDIDIAGYKPNVALSASYSGKDTNVFPSGENWGWSISLLVSGTIYNGGATEAKITQSKGNEELVTIRESALRDQIRAEVEQALQGITEGIETVKYNQANIDLAKEALRMAQARFDAGLGTTMDIMDAQDALNQALNGYYSGVSAYLTAVANLDMVVANDK